MSQWCASPAHSEPSPSQRVQTTLRDNTAMFLTPCSNTFVNPLPHLHRWHHYYFAAPFIGVDNYPSAVPYRPQALFIVFFRGRVTLSRPRTMSIGRGTIVPFILSICAHANNNQIIVVLIRIFKTTTTTMIIIIGS